MENVQVPAQGGHSLRDITPRRAERQLGRPAVNSIIDNTHNKMGAMLHNEGYCFAAALPGGPDME